MNEIQLIIGNKNYSSWSLRPWLLLKHLDIAFEEIRIPLFTDGFKAQIRQYSDAAKVPILKTRGMTLWDSLAICEYLGEQHPQLWPEDSADRALARCVVAEMHAGFQALRHELPMNCRARQRQLSYSDAAAADIQRIEQLWSQCRQRSLEQGYEGPWLFGRFGIVDAYYAPVAIRFQGYQLTLSEAAKAYCATQLENPLLRQWIDAAKLEAEVIPEEEVGD